MDFWPNENFIGTKISGIAMVKQSWSFGPEKSMVELIVSLIIDDPNQELKRQIWTIQCCLQMGYDRQMFESDKRNQSIKSHRVDAWHHRAHLSKTKSNKLKGFASSVCESSGYGSDRQVLCIPATSRCETKLYCFIKNLSYFCSPEMNLWLHRLQANHFADWEYC